MQEFVCNVTSDFAVISLQEARFCSNFTAITHVILQHFHWKNTILQLFLCKKSDLAMKLLRICMQHCSDITAKLHVTLQWNWCKIAHDIACEFAEKLLRNRISCSEITAKSYSCSENAAKSYACSNITAKSYTCSKIIAKSHETLH